MKHLHRFFSSDASGGIILIIAAVLAMIMANSGATSGWYHDFLETPVQLRVGSLEINKNMLLWINDALMAVFFLLVGLEVKRELMQGSLASLRQAAFPVIAAIGGMIVPALLYLAFNYADPITREGWAIPAATDIAFALGVLALLGSRVPLALKIFLMALAIILFGWLADVAPKEFLGHFTVFALACVVGFYVVWNVSHALHTPLMSVTNAISGIIVVGALLQIGHGGWVSFFSFIAVLIASINIFGGFTVTQRMLKMFRKN